jgi:hypothetical protein
MARSVLTDIKVGRKRPSAAVLDVVPRLPVFFIIIASIVFSIIFSLFFSGTDFSLSGHVKFALSELIDDWWGVLPSKSTFFLLMGAIDFAFYLFILVSGYVVFYYYARTQLRFRELTRTEARYAKAPNVSSGIRETSVFRPRTVDKHELIADNLNTRVFSLQSRATMIYWTILLTLGTGVFLVIFSGYLSSLDTASSLLWSRLDSELARTYTTNGANSSPDAEAIRRYGEHYNKVLDASITDITARNSQGRVWNWPSTIMRVSIAGLLIFLVQILIQLYRYNSRLVAFYSSRRDSIIMSEGDFEAAKQWETVFAPANLDFGREPRHPFQAIANLFGRGKFTDEEKEASQPGNTPKPPPRPKRQSSKQRAQQPAANDPDAEAAG